MTEYIKNPISGKLRGVTYEDGKIIDVHIRDTDDVVKVFVPVRHGRWNDLEVFWKECSCCKYRTQKINVREYFFCPNCGADMRGRTMDVMKGPIEPMGMESKEE